MLGERCDDNVAWLTLDRPERLNSFTVTDYVALRQALERAADDPDVHVVVITGAGRAFSAGADRSLLDGSASDFGDAAEEFKAFVDTLCGFSKPLLAAVNGLAIGIGCTMLLHCDLVLAAESARFRLPFTLLGVTPEAGSSVLLPARGRWDDAMWAMLSSEWIEADAAHRMGIAWRVVPDDALIEETTDVATTLSSLDPDAVAAAKRLLTDGRTDAVRLAGEREMAEAAHLAALRSSDDTQSSPPNTGGSNS